MGKKGVWHLVGVAFEGLLKVFLVCTPPATADNVVFHIFEKPRPRRTADNLPKVTESYRKKVIKVLVQFRGSFSTKIGGHLAQKLLLTAN